MTNTLNELLKYSGKYKILTIIGCILSGISAICSLIPFIYIWKLIEAILTKNYLNIQAIPFEALKFAILSIIIYYISLMLTHYSAFECEKNMKNTAMKHILKLPLGYFTQHTTGSIRKIIEYSTSQTESFLAHMLPDLIGAIITPITFIILLFYFNWKLGIICLIPIILSFIFLSRMFTNDQQNFMFEYQNYLEEMNSQAVEYLRGIPVTKTFQQTLYSFKNFHKSIKNYGEFVKKYSFSMQLPMTGFTVSVNGFFILLIPVTIIIATNPINNTLLLNLIFYIIFTPLCGVMINRIMTLSETLMISKQALDKINEILEVKPLPQATQTESPKNYSIEIENLNFKYENTTENTLKNINLKINEGETIALVGPSGSGKSTIAHLITRFWDTTEGKIKIGDINIKNISKEELNNTISFVFQNQNLIKDTILENITMGKQYTKEEIQNAIEQANCREIINKLPNGLNTIFGQNGLYLSGGEKQRIVLARALLKDAPIIILDEATSFADPENELEIQDTLNKITKNKTVIIIAHRLSAITNVDKIIVLENGEIIETGTHKELINKEGLFNKMWNEYNKSVQWKIGETQC